ncbi:hypothetical protein BDM02DRAFT_1773361 [Thelephora ganbajun]|uniref:Uncharacterized protein n=1 Tax=Thelephora ganbajun TaxID=370292 RepID=A0ACB6Z0A8_THEGA|nr:hypothetical protein BDM02DRAFT_1773361 [Thelephora ganbajun]
MDGMGFVGRFFPVCPMRLFPSERRKIYVICSCLDHILRLETKLSRWGSRTYDRKSPLRRSHRPRYTLYLLITFWIFSIRSSAYQREGYPILYLIRPCNQPLVFTPSRAGIWRALSSNSLLHGVVGFCTIPSFALSD